ncbi:unnamed protein product [Acanthosepion pharaonis]|uniref:Zasp-like motif domain-containing protein n=1 Tax=Acanthosepion pharaonis TaxID=158019 RepID=A0A812BWN9_ACAPH|nr:unnamed protein product [Sepia pharaonis]
MKVFIQKAHKPSIYLSIYLSIFFTIFFFFSLSLSLSLSLALSLSLSCNLAHSLTHALGAVTIWKPTVTPLSELRPSELKPIISATGEEIIAVQKTSLAKEKPDDICTIGSSHNRSARPFGAASGPQDSGPSVIHAQFNSPIGMYSAENLAETYSEQASSLRENMANMNVSGQAGRPQPMIPASAPGENSQASNVSSDEVLPHDGHATTFGRLEDELNKKEVDSMYTNCTL